MDIIQVEDLHFSYPGSDLPILDGLTLSVEKGDFLAIVGNNGCGKSTFCKTLNGLIPHFISGKISGSIIVDGVVTFDSTVAKLAAKVGYVYQDFENQIVRPTVLDDASYACLNYAHVDYLERGKKVLETVKLADKANEYIWALSGGQTHLLALAGALSLSPDILILDEPIAQLDPHHADIVYETLKTLNEQYGKTIIVIEHHTEYIASYCHHVVLLDKGKVKWKLDTQHALSKIDDLKASHIYPPAVTRAAHWFNQQRKDHIDPLPITLDQAKVSFKNYRQKMVEPPTPIPSSTSIMVEYQHVHWAYRSIKGEDRVIFDDLSFTLYQGDKVALIGSNGAGKSTLMKLMVGLLKLKQGDILLNGQSIRGKHSESLGDIVSLVYQNPEQMFIKDSIRKDIAFAMEARGISNVSEKCDELLKRFELTELSERDGRLLSGGQMRRASLAIGVALDPRILLLDEPTANLDMATRREIMDTLVAMKAITDTVVIATHDMQLVCEWANRIIVLHQGKCIADGSREAIFHNPKVIEVAGIRPPQIHQLAVGLNPATTCYSVDDFTRMFALHGGNYERVVD